MTQDSKYLNCGYISHMKKVCCESKNVIMPGDFKHRVDKKVDVDGNCEKGNFKSHKSLLLNIYIEG